MSIEEMMKEGLPSEHKHSGCETLMSGGANACPICQALEIQSLRAKLTAAEAELKQQQRNPIMPGAWICDRCKFILQKNTLHTGDGSISADTSPLNEKCPNDGQLMRPFTWREANDGFAEDNQKLRAELSALREDKARLDASPTWPYVIAFAKRMEAKLAKNRHKGDREGWLKDDPWSLVERVLDETVEVQQCFTIGSDGRIDFEDSEELADECADCANFCMMVADCAIAIDQARKQ